MNASEQTCTPVHSKEQRQMSPAGLPLRGTLVQTPVQPPTERDGPTTGDVTPGYRANSAGQVNRVACMSSQPSYVLPPGRKKKCAVAGPTIRHRPAFRSPCTSVRAGIARAREIRKVGLLCACALSLPPLSFLCKGRTKPSHSNYFLVLDKVGEIKQFLELFQRKVAFQTKHTHLHTLHTPYTRTHTHSSTSRRLPHSSPTDTAHTQSKEGFRFSSRITLVPFASHSKNRTPPSPASITSVTTEISSSAISGAAFQRSQTTSSIGKKQSFVPTVRARHSTEKSNRSRSRNGKRRHLPCEIGTADSALIRIQAPLGRSRQHS